MKPLCDSLILTCLCGHNNNKISIYLNKGGSNEATSQWQVLRLI